MKVAILSDIHGNIVALEAVLKDLKEQGGLIISLLPGSSLIYTPEMRHLVRDRE